MLEDYEESISLTLRTRSSKKPLGMLEKWKRQWLPLSLARHARKARKVRSVSRLMISSQNLRVSWKPVNPQECVWKNLYQNNHEDHFAGRGDNSLQHYNLVHKFISLPQAMKMPAAKAAVVKIMGETWKYFGVEPDESQKQVRGRRAEKFILPHWWTSVIWRLPNWRQSTKSTNIELYSEVILW